MNQFLKTIIRRFNLKEQCTALNVSLWSCPQFLFLVMGFVIIASILLTYVIAQRYAEAEIVALIVILLTGFLFVISYIIVSAFERVVTARQQEAIHAKQLIELKDQFVFIAAHELKTPARAIETALGKLEKREREMFLREHEIIRVIKESNKRLLALVQDLLEVARIEGNTIHLDLSDVSVLSAYEGALRELEGLKKERGVEVVGDIPDNTPLVRADEMRLKEVFVNFLSNAIKYSDKERGRVWVKTALTSSEVVISVSNNGPRISKEDEKHVFQKFWRSTSAQASKQEGTGLGLFIVRQLVELMGGRVWFDSDDEKTTFSVVLTRSEDGLPVRQAGTPARAGVPARAGE